MENNTLPDKFSAFIRVALDDLQSVEKDPQYRINMATWHSPNCTRSGVCDVCLAGAVMAKQFHASSQKECSPIDFRDNMQIFLALDDLIRGNIFSAYCRFIDPQVTMRPVDVWKQLQSVLRTTAANWTTNAIPQYARNPKRFFDFFYCLANNLEKAGF